MYRNLKTTLKHTIMKATKEQWNEIKREVKANFGREFQCKDMGHSFTIFGRDGMNLYQAELLYNVLNKMGFVWEMFDLHYRNNPIHKNTDCIKVDFNKA